MKKIASALPALVAGLALASPAALAAPRVVGGSNPTPSTPTTAAASTKKALEKGVEKNKSAPVGKGDTEFGISFLYSNYDDTDTNLANLTVNIGKFISDRAEISIQPSITYFDSAGSTTFSFDPFFSFKYLIRGANLSNPVVPFVCAGIGIDLSSSDSAGSSTFNYGLFVSPVVGVKAFVTERTSLEYQLSYNAGVIESCDVDCFGGSIQGLNNLLLFNIYY
jgi:hypothetical protein